MDFSSMFNKPEGFMGKIALMNMNAGHAPICNWALDQIQLDKYKNIIDIGCGGGATIKRILSRTTDSKICGIDYSSEAVNKSKKVNEEQLDKRVEIKNASVENIPYPDNLFDMAIAVETIYFWPHIIDSLKEVYRILKPNGNFYIVCESFDKNNPWQNKVSGMTVYNEDDYNKLLFEASFKDIKITTKDKWIFVKCTK